MKYILTLIFVSISLFSQSLPSNYYEIKNTKQMKKAFFTFMEELAQIENNNILQTRDFVKKNFNDKKAIAKITKRYGLKENASLEEYLYIIDIIPVSLVLSQAAIESGWGKSRFFKKANNIFGQWTWSGKGLTPASRDAGKKHKIKIFSSYLASVRGYMINLNKGWAYEDFRIIRKDIRAKNENLSGILLASGLIRYSQKREEYIRILKSFIKGNKLDVLDTY